MLYVTLFTYSYYKIALQEKKLEFYKKKYVSNHKLLQKQKSSFHYAHFPLGSYTVVLYSG